MNPNHGIRNLVFFFFSISSSSQSHAHHISTHLEYENSENLKKRKTNNRRRRKKRKGKTHGRPKNRRLFFDCIAVSWNSTNTVSSNFVDIFFLFIFSPPNRNRLSNIKRYSVLAFCTRVHSSKVIKEGGNKQRVFRYSRKACRPRKKTTGKQNKQKKNQIFFVQCDTSMPNQVWKHTPVRIHTQNARTHPNFKCCSPIHRSIFIYIFIEVVTWTTSNI